LLVEARQIADEEKRQAKYQEVEKMILEDSAFVLVYFYSARRIIQPYVKGFVLDAMENYDLSKVWLER
jgi:ABC-type transport system substrate-binding protein